MNGSELESLEILYPFLHRSETMGVVEVLNVEDTVASDDPATLRFFAVLGGKERKARRVSSISLFFWSKFAKCM